MHNTNIMFTNDINLDFFRHDEGMAKCYKKRFNMTFIYQKWQKTNQFVLIKINLWEKSKSACN